MPGGGGGRGGCSLSRRQKSLISSHPFPSPLAPPEKMSLISLMMQSARLVYYFRLISLVLSPLPFLPLFHQTPFPECSRCVRVFKEGKKGVRHPLSWVCHPLTSEDEHFPAFLTSGSNFECTFLCQGKKNIPISVVE